MTVQMEQRRLRRRNRFSKLFGGFKTQEVEEESVEQQKPETKKEKVLKVKITIE